MPSNNDLIEMIKRCSVEHSKLVKEAAMGNNTIDGIILVMGY